MAKKEKKNQPENETGNSIGQEKVKKKVTRNSAIQHKE